MTNYKRIEQELIKNGHKDRYDGTDMLTSKTTTGDIAVKCIDSKCCHENGCCLMTKEQFQEWNCKCAYQIEHYYR